MSLAEYPAKVTRNRILKSSKHNVKSKASIIQTGIEAVEKSPDLEIA